MQTKTIIGATVLVMFLPTLATALLIKPVYNDFNDTEKSIIAEGIKEWSDLLPCKDGKEIIITFTCDNRIDGNLGLTSDWNHTAPGDFNAPTVATITLHNDILCWWKLGTDASKEPNTLYDALTVIKHEICHAIGFTVICPGFAKDVNTVGGNRFYDFNHNGKFDDSDLDLVDDPAIGTHTLTGLMAATLGHCVRFLPTIELAHVLHNSFGYCEVPEPATVLLLGLGGLALLRKRKRM